VEDVTHNYKGMTDEELLEHMQNPETHQLIAAAMRLNANQYMLELAKEGAKLPSTYDVRTILEPSQENLPITTHTPFPPLPNIDLSLPLPPSSFPPMTANNTSLLQALQNHPLVDTQNLEANTVLGISPNPTNTFTPITSSNPSGHLDQGNMAPLTNPLGASSSHLGITPSPIIQTHLNQTNQNNVSNQGNPSTTINPTITHLNVSLISQHQVAPNPTTQPTVTPSQGPVPNPPNPTSHLTIIGATPPQPPTNPLPPQNPSTVQPNATNSYNATFQAAYQQALQQIHVKLKLKHRRKPKLKPKPKPKHLHRRKLKHWHKPKPKHSHKRRP
jgi:hypothetical protein